MPATITQITQANEAILWSLISQLILPLSIHQVIQAMKMTSTVLHLSLKPQHVFTQKTPTAVRVTIAFNFNKFLHYLIIQQVEVFQIEVFIEIKNVQNLILLFIKFGSKFFLSS